MSYRRIVARVDDFTRIVESDERRWVRMHYLHSDGRDQVETIDVPIDGSGDAAAVEQVRRNVAARGGTPTPLPPAPSGPRARVAVHSDPVAGDVEVAHCPVWRTVEADAWAGTDGNGNNRYDGKSFTVPADGSGDEAGIARAREWTRKHSLRPPAACEN
jgi:hypothetical protein